jgi:peptidoglycan/xylan/chitin deacetylase (PgdA/CDA1 family)
VHRESPAVARIAARQRRVDSDAIRRAIARSDYISLGSPRRRDIALTFDDGPGPYTPQILRVLVRRHAAATFFVVGSAVRQRPALVRDEQRLGFAIGNHTQDHLALGTLSSAAQLAQITQAGGAIRRAGAAPAPLFRPPYGSFSPTTLQLLRLEGLLMVLWTVDTKDYQRPGVQRIAYTALSGARGGAILLMHDGGGDRSQTVAALPTIIRRLRARGFHLVTVPQLVRDDPPPAHQPPPHSLAGAWSRVSGRTSTRPSPAGPPRR